MKPDTIITREERLTVGFLRNTTMCFKISDRILDFGLVLLVFMFKYVVVDFEKFVIAYFGVLQY